MRDSARLRGALVAALLVAALAASARAQDADVPVSQRSPAAQIETLPVPVRQRIERLWGQVVCDCPRENWSRTLANCPDGCADPQKSEVVAAVLAGRSDEQVLAEQERLHTARARATPVTGFGTAVYAIAGLLLVAAGVVSVIVLRRIGRGRAASPPPAPRDDAETAAVLRELQEID